MISGYSDRFNWRNDFGGLLNNEHVEAALIQLGKALYNVNPECLLVVTVIQDKGTEFTVQSYNEPAHPTAVQKDCILQGLAKAIEHLDEDLE